MFVKSKITDNIAIDDDFVRRESLISFLGEMLVKDKADLLSFLKSKNLLSNEISEKKLVEIIIDQCSRSDSFRKDFSLLIAKKDGLSESKLRSNSGSKTISLISKILNDLSKNDKVVQYIIEAKKQHYFMYYSEGNTADIPVIKEYKKRTGLNILLFGVSAFLAYKIYNTIKADFFNKSEADNIDIEEELRALKQEKSNLQNDIADVIDDNPNLIY